MTALPPELEALDAQYQQLTDSVEAGHITVANAMSALDGMMAVDPNGGVWRIDAEGDFTRADGHGMPAVKADPALWPTPGPSQQPGDLYMPPTAAQAPVTPVPNAFTQPEQAFQPVQPPPYPAAPVQDAPALFTPPAAYQNPGSAPAAPAWARNLDAAGPTTAPAYLGIDTDSGFEAPKSLSGSTPEPAKGRKKVAKAAKEPKEPKPAKVRRPGGSGPLAAVLERKKVIGLALFGVALLALAWFATHQSAPTSQPLPAASGTAEFTQESPTEAPAEPGQSATPASSDLDRVTSAYASSSASAAEQTINTDNAAALARAGVILAGAQGADKALDVASLKPGKNGGYTQYLRVVDTATGSTLFGATLTWKQADGQWKLASPPVFK